MKQIKRIAILGTENSHAQAFTNLIRTCPELTLIGAYGTEPAANERFSVNFGVPCVTDPAAFVGIADGVMITARNGATHLELARPYLTPGTAVFVDKPLCGTVADTEELLRLAERNRAVRRFLSAVRALAASLAEQGERVPCRCDRRLVFGTGRTGKSLRRIPVLRSASGADVPDRTRKRDPNGSCNPSGKSHYGTVGIRRLLCLALFRMRHLLGNGLLPDEHLRRNGQKHSEALYKGIFRIPCATQRHLPYRADRTCRPRPHCLCH